MNYTLLVTPIALGTALIALIVSIAILTGYRGVISLDWGKDGASLKIDGSPQQNKLDAQKTE